MKSHNDAHSAEHVILREFGVTTIILTPGACGKGSCAVIDDTGSGSSGVCPKPLASHKNKMFCEERTNVVSWEIVVYFRKTLVFRESRTQGGARQRGRGDPVLQLMTLDPVHPTCVPNRRSY